LSRTYGLTLWLNHCNNLRISGWFWKVMSVLPEDGAVSATCYEVFSEQYKYSIAPGNLFGKLKI